MSKIAASIAVIEARIAADTNKLAELKLALAAEGLVAEVGPNYIVEFKVGRAETRRTVEGVVLGRGAVKEVDSVRVTVGEGLEAELYTVPVGQLLAIRKPSQEEVAEAVGTLEASGQSESDDLLSEING